MEDLQARLAALENDLLLSRAQNGVMKSEMDRLRARCMALEAERGSRVGAGTSGTPSKRISQSDYAHLESTHAALVAQHTALIEQRKKDVEILIKQKRDWDARRKADKERIKKLEWAVRKSRKSGEGGVKRSAEEAGVGDAQEEDGPDGKRQKKAEQGSGEAERPKGEGQACGAAQEEKDKAASTSPLTPLRTSAKAETPKKSPRGVAHSAGADGSPTRNSAVDSRKKTVPGAETTVLQELPIERFSQNSQERAKTPNRQAVTKPAEETESIQAVAASGNAEQEESLHLLASLPPIPAAIKPSVQALAAKPISNILAEETLGPPPISAAKASQKSPPRASAVKAARSKTPPASPTRGRIRQALQENTSSPNAKGPLRGLAPRRAADSMQTPDVGHAPPRKAVQSEPAQSIKQTPKPSESTRKAHTDGKTKQQQAWLGRGNASSSKTSGSRRSKVQKHDSFEDDGPPVFRVPEVPDVPLIAPNGLNTPTHARRPEKSKAGPSRLGALQVADSPFQDRLLGGKEGQAKNKQLKELASMRGKERVEVYKEYKGHGRYGDRAERNSTRDNERYEIDPARNGGVAHAYHESIRNKEHRRHLPGEDCEECRNYYAVIGDLPSNDRSVPFRRTHGDDDEDRGRPRDPQAHKNAVSRHRDVHPRNKTPPGFWQMGFPTTQQVAEQNEIAEQMEAEKAARIKRDAEYVKRWFEGL